MPGNDELGRGVPSGTVEQQDGMGALRDRPGDLVEMGLHGVGIGEGHGDRRADAACGADCAKEIGVLVALIGGPARPGRIAGQGILLADAGFVLEPELDRLALRQMAEMGLQGHRAFLSASITRASCAGWCGRALMWEKPICSRSFPIVRP